jgi:hypothetical protein
MYLGTKFFYLDRRFFIRMKIIIPYFVQILVKRAPYFDLNQNRGCCFYKRSIHSMPIET